ncbi:BTAD domain-containing putative transcriptional regulator [Streptomyces sp. NPDC038707]|uniref:BTAD domain-containing putative transcriptional regulator n=1 Tax=Streptomyces sp. NPDC038707 TaxID=3154329 RepID=UPI0033FE7202
MPDLRITGTVTDRPVHPGPALPFPAQVRAFREQTGLTQREFAALSGISVRALRDIESGRVEQPQTRTLRRLADVLGLDVGDIRTSVSRSRRPANPGEPGLRIGILGALSIDRGGTVTEVRACKLRRLLSLLALCHPESASLDEIGRTLWPKEPPRSYQNLIHTYVSQARGLLRVPGAGQADPSPLIRTPIGYALSVGRDQIDLTRFQDLADRARRAHAGGDPAAAYEFAALAHRCWRGPILTEEPQLALHPAATAATRQRTENLLLYAELAVRFHQPELVVPALYTAAEDEPLNERLQARLMLALACCGEQSEALRVFAEVSRRLDAELGLQPGQELRQAHVRILQQQLTAPGGAPAARQPAAAPRDPVVPAPAPAGPPEARPSQLPGLNRHFVGRAAHLRELDRLLLAPGERDGQVPAALITGPPGVGKTALALRWAHRVLGRFPDGQLYVDLHGHARQRPLDALEAMASFLRALGVPGDRIPGTLGEATSLYRTRLSGRRVLVLVDNAWDEEQIRPLIPGDAGCAVLVTSRNALPDLAAREGVQRVALDGLDDDEALALLGRLLGPERVGREPLAAMALGKYCGGLPLVLRTLATRLVQHPCLGIAQYYTGLQIGGLSPQPADAGDGLLCSVQAAFELSYRVLPEPARRVFRLLGRTRGTDITSYTLTELAGLPPGEARWALCRLADASMVREHVLGRFDVPAPLLRYARTLLGQEEAERFRTA